MSCDVGEVTERLENEQSSYVVIVIATFTTIDLPQGDFVHHHQLGWDSS